MYIYLYTYGHIYIYIFVYVHMFPYIICVCTSICIQPIYRCTSISYELDNLKWPVGLVGDFFYNGPGVST